jgi:hypothetical protein
MAQESQAAAVDLKTQAGVPARDRPMEQRAALDKAATEDPFKVAAVEEDIMAVVVEGIPTTSKVPEVEAVLRLQSKRRRT